jgi:flagellar secretion chaperone FliS
MPGNSTELNYRRAAVQQASPAGLMVILYDLLVNDLQHAIVAFRRSAIDERSRHLNHALLILQILEGNLDMENGGAAAGGLAAFYGHVRSQLLDAQFRSDLAPLERQIALLLDLREAWRTADGQTQHCVATQVQPHAAPVASNCDETTPRPASWSA